MLRHIFLRHQQSTVQETIALHCLHPGLFALKFVMIIKIRCMDRYEPLQKMGFLVRGIVGHFLGDSVHSPLSSGQV